MVCCLQIDVTRKVKKLVEDATKGHSRRQATSTPTQQEMHDSRRTIAQTKGESWLAIPNCDASHTQHLVIEIIVKVKGYNQSRHWVGLRMFSM